MDVHVRQQAAAFHTQGAALRRSVATDCTEPLSKEGRIQRNKVYFAQMCFQLAVLFGTKFPCWAPKKSTSVPIHTQPWRAVRQKRTYTYTHHVYIYMHVCMHMYVIM